MKYSLDYCRRINASLIHAGLDHVIREMTLAGGATAQVTLAGYSTPWCHDGRVPTRARVSPPLQWGILAQLSAPAATQLMVRIGDESFAYDVEVLPLCVWDMRREFAAATAAFVMENSPTVTRIVRSAGCAPSVDGIEPDPGGVAARLYEAFQGMFGLLYLFERGGYKPHEQIVRFPAQILHDGGGARDAAGTCIDLALLYAAALRAAGVSSIICILGDEFGGRHSLVGFWAEAPDDADVLLSGERIQAAVRAGRLVLVEPNWLTRSTATWSDAVDVARRTCDANVPLWGIDIDAARDADPAITAMSVTVRSSDGEELVLSDLPIRYADEATTLRAEAAADLLDRHCLKAVGSRNDVDRGRTWPLKGSRIILGRRSRSNGIVLHDAKVSRDHAAVMAAGTTIYVSDLGSAHGTFLHGKRLSPYQPEEIHDGDDVTLGGDDIVLRLIPRQAPIGGEA